MVDWVTNAIKLPNLLGPFADVLPTGPEAKRHKSVGTEMSDSKCAQKKAILQSLAKHVRLVVMNKEFFCDRVRTFLTREESDSIMMFHMLGRCPPGQIATKRAGIQPVEQVQSISVSSTVNPDQAVNLPLGNAAWQVLWDGLQALDVKLPFLVNLTRIDLYFDSCNYAANGPMTRVSIQFLVPHSAEILTVALSRATLSQLLCFDISGASALLEVTEFRIMFPKTVAQCCSPASVTRVQVFGKRPLKAYAVEVANRLSADLLLLPPPSQPVAEP